jgi:hypothetical protein
VTGALEEMTAGRGPDLASRSVVLERSRRTHRQLADAGASVTLVERGAPASDQPGEHRSAAAEHALDVCERCRRYEVSLRVEVAAAAPSGAGVL